MRAGEQRAAVAVRKAAREKRHTVGCANRRLIEQHLAHRVRRPPRHEIDHALAHGPSVVRRFTLIGGLLGASFGYWIAIWISDYWALVVGGKPIASWVPYTIIAFEVMQPLTQIGGERHEFAVPVMAEVYVTRLLDRDEFRPHCDRFRTREAILSNLV